MKIREIRSATHIVDFAGKKFLIDPWLMEKGGMAPFPYTYNQDTRQPKCDLPIPVDEILKGINAVIVSHDHADHFDEVAMKVIPKDMKMFCQNETDARMLRNGGFKDVEIVRESGTQFGDITLYKTLGEHGRGEVVEDYYRRIGISGCKEVMGVVFKHPSEKTLYLCGDTIWCEDVKAAIDKFNPDVITVYAGYAHWLYGGNIIMGKYDVLEVFRAAPKAKIVAVHLENVNHGLITRKELKEFIAEKGMTGAVLVPDDGETLSF